MVPNLVKVEPSGSDSTDGKAADSEFKGPGFESSNGMTMQIDRFTTWLNWAEG